jgi:16S rRNA G966 N2-methylase RsmD
LKAVEIRNFWASEGANLALAPVALRFASDRLKALEFPGLRAATGNSSKSRDIVLDPFGGSGSTLIASEKAGRQARLIELDPKYCDVIIRRWQEFSGGTATLDREGRTYDGIVAERKTVAA